MNGDVVGVENDETVNVRISELAELQQKLSDLERKSAAYEQKEPRLKRVIEESCLDNIEAVLKRFGCRLSALPNGMVQVTVIEG